MATSKVWPSTGSTNVTSTSYSIPQAGNVNWASLTDFLVALANGAQSTTFQRFALRVATSTPVTISVNDCVVQTNLTVPGAVAVTLPAGVQKYIYFISDGKGDAGTNNITITPNAGETIAGQATYVIDTDYGGAMFAFQSSDNDWKVILQATPNGTVDPSSITLANGKILIGNASNVAEAQTMSGDITIDNAGVTAIGAGVIVNADISASAAIDFSKLATLTAGNLILGSAGNVATSTAMSGDITIDSSGVTAIGSGVIVNADVNATAAIAVSKLAALTASRAIVSDVSGFISAATTTATEIGYVNGVTSSIQAQLDAKTSNPLTTTGDIIYASNTATPATAARLGIGAASTVLQVSGGLPSWGLIANANVDAAAAIAGTKISPDFGSQNVATTGVYSGGATTITTPGIYNAKQTTSIVGYYVEATNADTNVTGIAMKNDARDWRIQVRGDTADDFAILDNTAGSFRFRINSSGVITFSAYTTGVAHFDASGVITSSTIVNADVSASAAIAGTKISPDFGSQNVTTTGSITGASFQGTSANVVLIGNGTNASISSQPRSGTDLVGRNTALLAGLGTGTGGSGSLLFQVGAVGASGTTPSVAFNAGQVSNAGQWTLGETSGTQTHVVNGQINLTGGQITFPATQNPSAGANTLDDYEEGTWTPSFTPAAGSGMTYTARVGLYTKIGNVVNVSGHIILSGLGTASGIVTITLPFSQVNITDAYTTVTTTYWSAMTTSVNAMGGYLTPNTATLRLSRTTAAATALTTLLTVADLSATTDIIFSTTILTAS